MIPKPRPDFSSLPSLPPDSEDWFSGWHPRQRGSWRSPRLLLSRTRPQGLHFNPMSFYLRPHPVYYFSAWSSRSSLFTSRLSLYKVNFWQNGGAPPPPDRQKSCLVGPGGTSDTLITYWLNPLQTRQASFKTQCSSRKPACLMSSKPYSPPPPHHFIDTLLDPNISSCMFSPVLLAVHVISKNTVTLVGRPLKDVS